MRWEVASLRRTWRRLSRWAQRSRWLGGLRILVLATVLILALPVILPLVAVLEARDRWRRHVCAERFVCVGCGQVLGRDALTRADTDWAEYVARLHRERPGVRFRLVRDVNAVCGHCGARYRFDEKAAMFSVLMDQTRPE